MNYSSLFAVVTPFAAVRSGIGAARDARASLVAVILFGLGGLVVVVGVAVCSIGLANSVLMHCCRQSSKLVATGYGLAYFFWH